MPESSPNSRPNEPVPHEPGPALRLLAIESATSVLSVALLRGEQFLEARSEDAGMRHSERLLPMIDELLSEAGCGPADIGAFGVSIGPGSFTSLRVGLATVKGLAFSGDVPAIGVPTLSAIAWGALRSGVLQAAAKAEAPPTEIVVAMLDARRGEVYAGGIEVPATPLPAEGDPGRVAPAPELVAAVPDGLHAPDELGALIAESGRGAVLVGEGAALFGEVVVAAAAGLAWVAPPEFGRPSASAVGELAAAALRRGERGTADELIPRYVRRAEAEATRLGRAVE